MTIRDQLTAYLQAADRATAGPWCVAPIVSNSGDKYPTLYQAWVFVEPAVCGLWAVQGTDMHDADFIAASRTVGPAAARGLLRAVEALEAERNRFIDYSVDRTHWEGCESVHRVCATVKRIDAALAEIEALFKETP